MSYDDPDSATGQQHCRVGRSDSSITTLSVDSASSPNQPYNPANACVTIYVNNIPITPVSSHKKIPVTEVLNDALVNRLTCDVGLIDL